MTAKSMDVFSLRDAVVDDYRKFATSFTTIHADDIREQVAAIYAEGRYWPEPLIQINPSYQGGASVDRLVADGVLDAGCADIFRTQPTDGTRGAPLSLYKHQQEAIAIASQGQSYVVTTGTGSGKSLCFFIPIVSAVLAEKRAGGSRRTRAIVIYPMNALANSQLEELNKYVDNVPGARPVTFERYTGQEKTEERQRIAENPPDILLTNFMMLELLMTRQDPIDRKVIGNCAGLRFLVLDELHTYRGRQGADVALLVRRIRERLAPDGLQCIGTSATMASEGSQVDKNRLVAAVASKLFAAKISESEVVVETLERRTERTLDKVSAATLGKVLDDDLRSDISDADLRVHPLAVWVEKSLGVTFSEIDQRWIRAKPRTVTEAVNMLGKDSGRDATVCRKALRDFLLLSAVPESDRTKKPGGSESSFFAFKLHQFISGAGHAFATLEPPGARRVTVEGQQFLPGDPEKRLYPVHFCRECGHEYHPVRLTTEDGDKKLLARDIDDAPIASEEDELSEDDSGDTPDGGVFGFLTLHPPEPGAEPNRFTFENLDTDYPEAWLDYDPDGNPTKLKSYYRPRGQRPVREYRVEPTGKIGSGTRAWFMPGKFRLCLRCGETQATAARDRNRLASLSAEGRSSATTVLVTSALRWMHGKESGLAQETRKLLGFTDNRQDAALQAGHFNDFLFVSLIRAGFLGALDSAGPAGLTSAALGDAQQKALGFDRTTPAIRAEWLLEPTLKGVNLQEAEATLREVLAYRVWFDQRRGWRFTNPNLEQLGLVEVDYVGLNALATDDPLLANAPDVLRQALPEVRKAVFRKVLDHLRKSMAVRSRVLDTTASEQLFSKAHAQIRAPWGFGTEEKPRPSRWLMVVSPEISRKNRRDEDLLVRGGGRSALGKALKTSNLWGGDSRVLQLKPKDLDVLIEALLNAAKGHGLVSQEATPFAKQAGWKLNDACVLFKKGTPAVDPRYLNDSAFFRSLYGNLARMLRDPGHPLFGFEAREHTAQVEGPKRELREKRFRFGKKEREELAANDTQLREIGESNRFLPVLFCSPTMELGVDISALNAVYLRNVPPTPANYAQRSGRAGRSGQAALVLTYCSSQGPHDQYFFQKPREMVHGEVRPPLIDLANRELVESHLQAVWLACTEKPLNASISELLVLNDKKRPLKLDVKGPMSEPRVTDLAVCRMEGVLDLLAGDLAAAAWYQGRHEHAVTVAHAAVVRFEKAFDRWRNLFMAAEQQRDAARRTMDDYAAPQPEKRGAKGRHGQATDQLDLLQQGTSTSSSDFYTYRYLATEGFLPGYNFPRLPLLAYVPVAQDGRGKQTYLQRPRFLALSEFGPRSLVYHEGRAFRVVRALLSLENKNGANNEAKLSTQAVRICASCGGGHFNEDVSLCHACGQPLGDAERVNDVYRIENVATQQAERITANDEERQRQGFDLQTTFEWATRDGVLDVQKGAAADSDGDLLSLVYGTGATITRLNKGLRRRADKKKLGFLIDPVSGWFASADDEEEKAPDPTAAPRQTIVPSVRDHKNALLLLPVENDLEQQTLATFQYAMLRGIEAVFQLEQGEVLAEPMPSRDKRKGFLLYEAAEGGAGVLTRLVSEPRRFAEVARRALGIMHFEVTTEPSVPSDQSDLTDAPGTSCVAACYRCLMSYYNQPDHQAIDRRDEDARQLLVRLARAVTTTTDLPIVGSSSAPVPPSSPDGDTGSRWDEQARVLGIPRWDASPLDGYPDLPGVWRAHYVAAALGDTSPATLAALEDKGFEIIVFGDEESWPAAFTRLATALGRKG